MIAPILTKVPLEINGLYLYFPDEDVQHLIVGYVPFFSEESSVSLAHVIVRLLISPVLVLSCFSLDILESKAIRRTNTGQRFCPPPLSCLFTLATVFAAVLFAKQECFDFMQSCFSLIFFFFFRILFFSFFIFLKKKILVSG